MFYLRLKVDATNVPPNKDAALKELVLAPGNLDPKFDPKTLKYAVKQPFGTKTMKVIHFQVVFTRFYSRLYSILFFFFFVTSFVPNSSFFGVGHTYCKRAGLEAASQRKAHLETSMLSAVYTCRRRLIDLCFT